MAVLFMQAAQKGASTFVIGVIISSSPFAVAVLSPSLGYLVSCLVEAYIEL